MDKQRRCVFVINTMSGSSDKLPIGRLEERLGRNFDISYIYLSKQTVMGDLSCFDRIVACGGDGTLNGILNSNIRKKAEIFFVPCGTFNEASKNAKKLHTRALQKVGAVDQHYFSYVCAAGSFTPLGYCVPEKSKKRLKFLAYFNNVVKQYEPYYIGATVTVGNENIQGPFTLIMAINSPRCFGFRFNKIFNANDGNMQLLLIKSPKHKGLLGKIEIFFPFFRAFFIGFHKIHQSKRILFISAQNAIIEFEKQTAFNFDGELRYLSGVAAINVCACPFNITILSMSDF